MSIKQNLQTVSSFIPGYEISYETSFKPKRTKLIIDRILCSTFGDMCDWLTVDILLSFPTATPQINIKMPCPSINNKLGKKLSYRYTII